MCLLDWLELTLEVLALDCCVAETLSEEVLRVVATLVTSVAAHGDHHFLIGMIVGKHSLETISQTEEAIVRGNFALEHHGLHSVFRKGILWRYGAFGVLINAESTLLAVGKEAVSLREQSFALRVNQC